MKSLLIGILLLPSLAIAWESPEVRPQIGQVVRVEMLAWIKLGDQWTEEWLEVRTITYTGTWPTGEGAVGEKVLRWEPAGPTKALEVEKEHEQRTEASSDTQSQQRG